MNVSRRALLGCAAGGAIALSGCGTLQNILSQWNTAVADIQAAVAKYGRYIPTVETIAAEAAALFGPQYEAIVVAGSAALNQVIAVLTKVVTDLAPPAQSRLAARLHASSVATPIKIGVTPEGITVAGFKVG